MIQLPLGFRYPGGKVGNVFRALLKTSEACPLTLLTLALYPGVYGTDAGRNIRWASKHFEKIGYTVESVPVEGETWHRYYIKRRSDISERRLP
jgi:hypothetical protein